MYWRRWKFFGCFSCLLFVLSVSNLGCTSAQSANFSCQNQAFQASSPILSEKQLRDRAARITVKVMSQDVLGTGFLLSQRDCIYTVVTNAHVLRSGKPPYRIQTNDNQIWQVETKYLASEKGDDLAILQFHSQGKAYTVSSIGLKPVIGASVVAAGFPFAEDGTQTKGFTFSSGKVSLILDRALQGGYQIGYTNDIQKGMSGGALLNLRGEVVGVNGMHAFPLWDMPSVFESGKETDRNLHQQITRLSWAVPMEKVKQKLGVRS